MTCAQLGGPVNCAVAFTGNSLEEIAGQGGTHLMSTTDEDHKAARDMMQNSKPEDQAQWMADMMPKFAAQPEL